MLKTEITLTIEFEKGDELPPEAIAVQQLQNQFAALARLPVDELAELWRQAVQRLAKRQETIRQRPRHRHGGR